MLSFSQSAALPQSGKRDRPHSDEPPKPRPRMTGPFVDDDDDDDDDEVQEKENKDPEQHTLPDPEPSPKRRMVHDPRDDSAAPPTEPTTNEATPDVIETDQTGDEDSAAGPDASSTQKSVPAWSTQRPLFSESLMNTLAPSSYSIVTSDGKASTIKERKMAAAPTYEAMVASRSKTKEGRAKKSYYGIDIHELIDGASKEMATEKTAKETAPENDIPMDMPVESVERPGKKTKKNLLWTEKYRARNFMDLCGDDGTNRMVLRWLKRWDPVVFPGLAKSRPVIKRPGQPKQAEEEKPHRKILMLTGPPGLGKTTLAHVCAKQAGYEVLEVNASDDRSRDVVKNRIRTSLGTETVKTVSKGSSKPVKPVCVVVDEVDGAVTGSGGSGEGGFVKALIDLVQLDEKNSLPGGSSAAGSAGYGKNKKKKGDDFRLMRPLVLICNDVYHPSLRPLRHSGLAEVIHVGRPSIDAVVGRLKAVFDKEAIPCDKDAARKLCEAAWGVTGGMQNKRRAESTVEGDLRGVMVVGEWVAGRFRSSPAASGGTARLTRQWIEQNVMHDLTSGAAGARGLGRGSVKDIVGRLFQLGGGFPQPPAADVARAAEAQARHGHEQPKTELGFGEQQKKYAMERLREMADTSGEISYILAEVFAEYPQREFNDDSYLSKPNQAYDWLHFADACQSRLYASQEWELAPYLSQPVLACHHLFASPHRHQPQQQHHFQAGGAAEEEAPKPFTGPRADAEAREAEKHTRAQLQTLQAQLTPTLTRSFRSAEDVATEFLPYLRRIVSPDVRPVVVGGSEGGSTATVRKESEKAMVRRAAEVLAEVGVALHRGKIEGDANARNAQYVYRMDPDLDALGTFETAASLVSSHAPTRYAVRQVLDQELQRTLGRREAQARQARFRAGGVEGEDEGQMAPASTAAVDKALREAEERKAKAASAAKMVKRDFFGRVIEARDLAELDTKAEERAKIEERKVWVTYHEGMNNAVRKPLALQEFLRGL